MGHDGDVRADLGHLGVVVNPVSRDAARAVDLIVAETRVGRRWDEPDVLPTTVTEPGESQARALGEAGCDRILVVGGDGTLRHVVAGLEGFRVELGIVPAGTANLVARNVGLPLHSTPESIHVALSGGARPIDVGRARLRTTSGEVAGSFLVLAGIGRDALTLHRVPAALKRMVGWPAYLAPAASTMPARAVPMRWRSDEGPQDSGRVWSVLAVNCGRLPLGVRIAPAGRPDDGLLDTLVVAPRGGGDWARIAAKGFRGSTADVPGLTTGTARRVEVVPDTAQPLQLDGDVVPAVLRAEWWVDPEPLAVVVGALR